MRFSWVDLFAQPFQFWHPRDGQVAVLKKYPVPFGHPLARRVGLKYGQGCVM